MATGKPITFDSTSPAPGKNAHFAAWLAGLAYQTQPEIEAGLRERGYNGTDVIFVRHPLLSCFIIGWDDDVTAIAFKGSTSWREWLNNLHVWPQLTDRGRIHAGYLYVIENLGPLIYPYLYPDLQAGKKIVLTGHSRGGAIALLFANALAMNGHRAHSVWGFGSPMVGDEQFHALFKTFEVPVRLYRYRDDPVPLFPPGITTRLAIIRWLLQFKAIFIPLTLIYWVVIVLRQWPIRTLLMQRIRRALSRSEGR